MGQQGRQPAGHGSSRAGTSTSAGRAAPADAHLARGGAVLVLLIDRHRGLLRVRALHAHRRLGHHDFDGPLRQARRPPQLRQLHGGWRGGGEGGEEVVGQMVAAAGSCARPGAAGTVCSAPTYQTSTPHRPHPPQLKELGLLLGGALEQHLVDVDVGEPPRGRHQRRHHLHALGHQAAARVQRRAHRHRRRGHALPQAAGVGGGWVGAGVWWAGAVLCSAAAQPPAPLDFRLPPAAARPAASPAGWQPGRT